MDHIICPTMLIHPQATVPTRGNDRAMGYDITCVAGLEGVDQNKWPEDVLRAWDMMAADGFVELLPQEGFLFRTGFAQAINEGYACMLWDRSGMGGSRMIHRCAGVIDEDYRGEWFVRLVNLSHSLQRISCGDKIVQGVYQQRVVANCPIVTDLPGTDRGANGFGSTDKQ